MDNETKKILSDGEKLKLMTEHEGWDVARSLLSQKILELQMIGDVIGLEPTKMAIRVEAKDIAKAILFEFLKDIEGNVEQYINNNIPVPKIEGYVVRED